MSETMEYDGLLRNMGDLVFDDDAAESLYHYEKPAPAPRGQQARPARSAEKASDMADADAAPPAVKPQQQAPQPQVAPKRGLKTPLILGASAGVLTAAGVYGFLRWQRPREDAPGKLAGVAGGVSGVGVLMTILMARGLGALDRGQQRP